jgi:hypothetical protein
MFRELNAQVVAFLHQGRYPQALPLAVRACEETQRQTGDGSPELAVSLSYTGTVKVTDSVGGATLPAVKAWQCRQPKERSCGGRYSLAARRLQARPRTAGGQGNLRRGPPCLPPATRRGSCVSRLLPAGGVPRRRLDRRGRGTRSGQRPRFRDHGWGGRPA